MAQEQETIKVTSEDFARKITTYEAMFGIPANRLRCAEITNRINYNMVYLLHEARARYLALLFKLMHVDCARQVLVFCAHDGFDNAQHELKLASSLLEEEGRDSLTIGVARCKEPRSPGLITGIEDIKSFRIGASTCLLYCDENHCPIEEEDLKNVKMIVNIDLPERQRMWDACERRHALGNKAGDGEDNLLIYTLVTRNPAELKMANVFCNNTCLRRCRGHGGQIPPPIPGQRPARNANRV